jgi:hypothetical protein
MFQVYTDDSGTGGAGAAFILAGYIASAETWAKFSEEWAEMLGMSPRIRYFKMSEAWNLSGEFLGWSEERRNERAMFFYRIIERHVVAEFRCVVPHIAFEHALQRLPKVRDPLRTHHVYHFALTNFVIWLVNARSLFRITDPLEFIFDEQLHKDGIVKSHWEGLRNNPSIPQGSIIGLPSFKDDKQVLPLQAADMNAWWTRRRWADKSLARSASWQYPWDRQREIPGIEISYDEDKIFDEFVSYVVQGMRAA